MANVATVNWNGFRFRAEPIRKHDNGNWLMIAREPGPRWEIGHDVEVRPDEIEEMDVPSAPTPLTTDNKRANMTDRLRHKLGLAALVSKQLSDELEARADRLIDRRVELQKKSDTAFMPHEMAMDDAEAGLNEVESALALLSNGGPPLGGSSGSSTA